MAPLILYDAAWRRYVVNATAVTRDENPTPTEYEAGRIQEPVRIFCKRQKSLIPARIRTWDRPPRSLVTNGSWK